MSKDKAATVTAEPKACFVISPIGEEGSDVRRRANQVLKHLIKPAVELRGFKAIRADEIDKPGLITTQVIQSVVNDPLVIADITDSNPNVFYELAVRHAARKPLIQIIEKGQRIPFDVAGLRTISFDYKDLDSVAQAKDDIVRQIDESEEAADMETPISVALELQILRQSDNPDDRNYAEVIAAMSDIRKSVEAVGERAAQSAKFNSEVVANAVAARIMSQDPLRSSSSPRYKVNNVERLLKADDKSLRNPVTIAILASIYKEIAPWVYEMGMEAYRQTLSRDKSPNASLALKAFKDAASTLHRQSFFDDEGVSDPAQRRMLNFAEHLLFSVDASGAMG